MALPLGTGRLGAPLRVVLIDPYVGSREGLRASLESAGCRVHVAGDALHALALLRTGGFDMGVIDLDLLPARGVVGSAWELARLFRVYNPAAPIVLLTAELDHDLEAEAGTVNPALLLAKPIDPARLRAVVRQLRTAPAAG
jgi:CheY-like chemotaxis protein